jgi:hypothetical protein
MFLINPEDEAEYFQKSTLYDIPEFSTVKMAFEIFERVYEEFPEIHSFVFNSHIHKVIL